MRLWSFSPRYLDSKGLVALWREALLAKSVLEGKTRGYRKHPQLVRFLKCRRPGGLINIYLEDVWEEAERRGFNFDKRNIGEGCDDKATVTKGQVEYEFEWLKEKLQTRNREKLSELEGVREIEINRAFEVVEGDVESWEVLR